MSTDGNNNGPKIRDVQSTFLKIQKISIRSVETFLLFQPTESKFSSWALDFPQKQIYFLQYVPEVFSHITRHFLLSLVGIQVAMGKRNMGQIVRVGWEVKINDLKV